MNYAAEAIIGFAAGGRLGPGKVLLPQALPTLAGSGFAWPQNRICHTYLALVATTPTRACCLEAGTAAETVSYPDNR
jgi:hypothetical protein